MKKISKRKSIFEKVFVFGLCGFLFFLFVYGCFSSYAQGNLVLSLFCIFSAYVIVVIGVGHRRFFSSLADEVYDCGTYLLIHHKGKEEQIALRDILNIETPLFAQLSRITLYLRHSGEFGSKIAFSPIVHPVSKSLFNPKENPIAKDLILRADQAKLSTGQSAFN